MTGSLTPSAFPARNATTNTPGSVAVPEILPVGKCSVSAPCGVDLAVGGEHIVERAFDDRAEVMLELEPREDDALREQHSQWRHLFSTQQTPDAMVSA